MKKLFLFPIALLILVSCTASPSSHQKGSAAEIMAALLSQVAQEDGFVYSSALDAALPLSDALLERMFPDTGDTADLECVVSAAVYFSKRFSEHEIVIFELCDRSHTEKIVRLLQKRAKKKENAVVFADGVYVYLICTDCNEAISRYLKP